MTDVLFAIGDTVMLFALLGALLFAGSYALFFNWRKTRAGRALLYLILALDAWAVQSFLSRLNPDYPGREWVRLVVYTGILVTVWGLLITLWRAWRTTPNKGKKNL